MSSEEELQVSMEETAASADAIPIVVLTNERTPFKGQQILMMYQAAALAQLAYMDGLNPDTGETEALLVGLEPTEEGQFKVFPLAKLFTSVDTIPAYLVPDGQGGYFSNADDTNLADIEEAGPPSEG